MNVYTAPRLLDVQEAVESLPSMSVTTDPNENRQRIAAGAENLVAPNADFSSDSPSTAVSFSVISSEMNEPPKTNKTPGKTCFPGVCRNTPGGSRTPNLRIRSPTLYPIELRAQAELEKWYYGHSTLLTKSIRRHLGI